MRAAITRYRFALLPLVQVFCIATFFVGGAWFWAGFAFMLAGQFLFDALEYDERGASEKGSWSLENGALYAALPLHAMLTALLLFHLSDSDFLGLGEGVAAIFGYDLFAVRSDASWFDLAGAVVCAGVMCSAVSGSAGHELMHRIHSRPDVACARLLLAFCGHTSLTIEHVFGHHRTVGTPDDPTTARRGTGFWAYLPRAILGTNRNAFLFEAHRLLRKGKPVWSAANRVLQGHIMSLMVLGCFVAGAGWSGFAAYMVIAVIGHVVIEQFNYVGHYGLVRVPGTPVMPRHSWNAFQLASTSVLFNLPRHSSHHSSPTRPYWALEPEEDALETPYGTILMAVIALAPPVWFRVIAPKLKEWDETLASVEERALISRCP